MSTVAAPALVAAQKALTDANVRPGLIGLFFFVALFVALYFLWRSMNTQLRKVDANFSDQNERPRIPLEDELTAARADDPTDDQDQGPAR